jgi:hypothetical protein
MTSSQMIPDYWLKRKHMWLDKKIKPTTDWNEAAFICEGGEYVRIVKEGDVYDQLHKLGRGR